jgi:hypothetical protein
MTKSLRAVAREALAREAIPPYSSKFSRQDFTQHPHFALLARKTFFKTDYRGLVQMLVDFSALRDDLGLTQIPDHSPLCKAQQQLLKKGWSFSSSFRPPCAPKTAA